MKKLLKKEYKKLKDKNITITGKVNLLNNIVEFKLCELEYKSLKNDLSIDIKRYLNSLIELAENGARNYDIINEDKLAFLDKIDFNEKLIYIDYLIRILEKSSFKDDIKKLQKLKYKTIIKHSFENWRSLSSICNIVIYFPLYNIYTLVSTLFIIALITNLILLEAPHEYLEFLNYKVEYLELSNNYYLNHFLNITSGLLGVNSKLSITPLDSKSMIIMMLGKIFTFSYVVTMIFNKLSDLIKR